MGCMTDEQLQELHKDVESGLVMIVETKHYEQLEADNKVLTALLRRAKKTFEPFPVCSDLRSMTQRLREKRPETEVKAIKKGFAKHQAKFRKLYRDIEQALKGN